MTRELSRWRRWHPDTVSLALLSLVSFGISLKFAFDMPPLWGADERAHAGYAIELMRGNLPKVDTWVLDDPDRFPQLSAALEGWKTVGRQIWVANHPPLYYLIVAPLIALAEWLGVPGAGLLAMRVVNSAATAGCVVLAGLLAKELVPGRRAVMLLAAALAGAASTLSMEGGYGYNDGLAALASTATLLMGVRLLRRGPSRRLLIGAAVAATLAAGLKAPNLIAIAACTVMAAVAAWLHADRDRWWRAIGSAAVVGGVPALGFGWFYLRNLALYGDLTGANVLLGAFQRRTHEGVFELITSPSFYRGLFESFWVRPGYDPHLRVIPDALFAAAALGVLLLAATWLRHRLFGGAGLPDRSAAARGLRVAWVAVLTHAVLVLALLIQFRSSGGYISQRYLLPIAPVMVTVLAVGVLRLAAAVPNPDRERWDAMVMLLTSTGMLLLAFVAYRATMVSIERSKKVPGLELPALGSPAPAFALGVAALAAVGFLLVQALRVVGDSGAGHPDAGRADIPDTGQADTPDTGRAPRRVDEVPEEAQKSDNAQLSDMSDMSSAPAQLNSGSTDTSTAIFTSCSAYLLA